MVSSQLASISQKPLRTPEAAAAWADSSGRGRQGSSRIATTAVAATSPASSSAAASGQAPGRRTGPIMT
ncbi:hypothetical protein GCM10022402_28500 [Salinactinospora qingdaonensis]|uniref:Uncharacterized protein n=1 Tax=Salinactinospora qingdaonensis TaxID=702744 RepID=A0ABP7FUM1_9ACTN